MSLILTLYPLSSVNHQAYHIPNGKFLFRLYLRFRKFPNGKQKTCFLIDLKKEFLETEF